MSRRALRPVAGLLLALGLFAAGCGKDDGKPKAYKAEDGIWRCLKRIEASLNGRTWTGYHGCFDGLALAAVLKVGEKRFLGGIDGRYKLGPWKITARQSDKLASAEYVFHQYLPSGKQQDLPAKATFAYAPGKDYWVLISFK